jgi:hypothetical protein
MTKLRLSILAFSALLLSCASTPNKFGHHYDYPYKAPSHVMVADEDECSRFADKEAFKPENIGGISDWPAIAFGPIGTIVQITRMKHALNSGYEKAMKVCLRQKGYVLLPE